MQRMLANPSPTMRNCNSYLHPLIIASHDHGCRCVKSKLYRGPEPRTSLQMSTVGSSVMSTYSTLGNPGGCSLLSRVHFNATLFKLPRCVIASIALSCSIVNFGSSQSRAAPGVLSNPGRTQWQHNRVGFSLVCGSSLVSRLECRLVCCLECRLVCGLVCRRSCRGIVIAVSPILIRIVAPSPPVAFRPPCTVTTVAPCLPFLLRPLPTSPSLILQLRHGFCWPIHEGLSVMQLTQNKSMSCKT